MGYEIIVRKYDDDGKMLEEEKLNGEDGLFSGVMIMGDKENGCTAYMEHMTTVDMACGIASDDTFLAAAMIAEAMDRAREMQSKRKMEKALKAKIATIEL